MYVRVSKEIAVIIPARNEGREISGTLQAVLEATGELMGLPGSSLQLSETAVEVVVVDNDSTDDTREVVCSFANRNGVVWEHCDRLRAPCARNHGVERTKGRILVFVDADTRIPAPALRRIKHLVEDRHYGAGIFALQGDSDTFQSRVWWTFWNHVRRLPLAKAKAMPAFMFCTREVFSQYGPFDESVQIGEEWPVLAGLYKANPRQISYDRTLVATTSDRRMGLQRFGYARVFIKYVWAILHSSGRNGYPDTIR